jgi:hypothetical protein
MLLMVWKEDNEAHYKWMNRVCIEQGLVLWKKH